MKIKFNNQLPLTIQNVNVNKKGNSKSSFSFVSVKSLNSEYVFAESFFKPISKIIIINE